MASKNRKVERLFYDSPKVFPEM